MRPRCTCARFASAASSRSRTRSRSPRAGGRRHRRPERLGQVEHRRRDRLGGRVARLRPSFVPRSPTTSSSREAVTASRPSTARSSSSSTTRTAPGPTSTSPRSRSRGGSCAEPRGSTSSTAQRYGAPTSSRSSRTSGSARRCTRSSARARSSRCSHPGRGSTRVRRGGRRAREVQASAPSRRAEARPRRAAGRARTRRRGGGAQALAAARAPGHGGRAGREARARDRGGSARGSRSSTSPTQGRDGPRPRSGAIPRPSRSVRRRGGWRGCSPIALVRRRSSRTQPDGVRLRLPAATGCRVGSSGWSSGRSRRPRCSSGSGPRRLRADEPSRTERRRASRARGGPSSGGGARRRAGADSARSSVPHSFASAFAHSTRRWRSRRAFRPPHVRSPRTARASRSARSTSPRGPSARLRPPCGPGPRQSSPTTRLSGSRLLQRARAAGLGSLTVSAGRSPQDLVGEYPVVPLERLLDVSTPSVTAEGFGYDPARGELWFVGETAEAVLLELQGRRSALAAEAAALDEASRDRDRSCGGGNRARSRRRGAYGRAPRLRAASVDARMHRPARRARGGATRRDRRRAPGRRPVRGSSPRTSDAGSRGQASSARSFARSARPR